MNERAYQVTDQAQHNLDEINILYAQRMRERTIVLFICVAGLVAFIAGFVGILWYIFSLGGLI